MMRHKHITLFSFLLALIINVIAASNTYAYSYMNFGGSILYVFEDNINITDASANQLKTLFQSGNNGIGGYISLGTVASYNAGYEIEVGFTSIKNIKDMQDEVLLSISGPYAFTNYFAQFGTTSPIRPYLGIGAGMMRITADDTVADSSIQNTEVTLAGITQKLKDVIISKKYRNTFAYQGMIGINLVTSTNSMVNLDYRYKASSSPIKFTRTDTEANAEYAYRTHGLNAGLKITF